MLGLALPLYPSDEVVAALCEQPGVQSWCLDETFHPRQASTCLSEPLGCFTPDLKISGRQWLIQASAKAKMSLQCGLLRVGQRCLYESNLANLDSKLRLLGPSASFPPGWWHRPRDPLHYQHPLLLLTTHNNPNYFHWLTQPGLAPLFLQEHFGLSSHSKTAIALSCRPRRSLPSYVRSILELLVPDLPVVQSVSIESQTSSRFSLQEHLSNVFISPAQIYWLNRRCRNAVWSQQKPHRRLFISRKNTSRRRCLNEDQLFASLLPLGFERLLMEELDVTRQIQVFSESQIVIASHGAGLANLVACTSQTKVIELVPRGLDLSHYFIISDILGLKHGHVPACYQDPESDNFAVDITDVLCLLREMIDVD